MRRFLKWSSGIVLLTLVCLIIAGAIVYSIFASTVTPENGSMKLAGLSADVEVVRDENAHAATLKA